MPRLLEHENALRASFIEHDQDACFGWFRYTSRFSLPIYGNSGEIEGINVFRGELLVRYAKNGKADLRQKLRGCASGRRLWKYRPVRDIVL